ncbi:MAG: hypothetical protein J7M21_05500 [Planctomycetes bacterium]|nr:hypothetical protein [Planctomycetota bacterium]
MMHRRTGPGTDGLGVEVAQIAVGLENGGEVLSGEVADLQFAVAGDEIVVFVEGAGALVGSADAVAAAAIDLADVDFGCEVDDGLLGVNAVGLIDDADGAAAGTVMGGEDAEDFVGTGDGLGSMKVAGLRVRLPKKTRRPVPSGLIDHRLWMGMAGRSTYSHRP